MNIKPILFSTPMVQAILEDRKTMTRRIVKSSCTMNRPQGFKYAIVKLVNGFAEWSWPDFPDFPPIKIKCPYGKKGDILWVREKWRKNEIPTGWPYHFYADDDIYTNKYNEKWKPSIFMPKEACRIFLEITNVRVERLQDISEEGAIAEGVEFHKPVPGDGLTIYKKMQNCHSKLYGNQLTVQKAGIRIHGCG